MQSKKFFNIFSENSDEILKIWPNIGCFLTLKADLARCMCVMNMVDGVLKHLCVVLSNSEIKSVG